MVALEGKWMSPSCHQRARMYLGTLEALWNPAIDPYLQHSRYIATLVYTKERAMNSLKKLEQRWYACIVITARAGGACFFELNFLLFNFSHPWYTALIFFWNPSLKLFMWFFNLFLRLSWFPSGTSEFTNSVKFSNSL